MNKINKEVEVYIKTKKSDDVYKEKALCAIDNNTKKVIAIGSEAEQLINSSAPNIEVISPCKQGVIEDFTVFSYVVKYMLRKATGKASFFRKPSILLNLPRDINISEVGKKAYEDVLILSGARNVVFSFEDFELISNDINVKFDIYINIAMEDKKAFLKEQLEDAFKYAGKNNISKDEIINLINEVEIN